MIVTWQIAARLAVIVVAGVLVQISFLSYLSILGATPELMPAVVAALGLLGGAVPGAVLGFIAGLLLDSALLQTLGVSSLVLLSVGYLAGRYRELFEIDSNRAPVLLAAGLTLFAAAAFAALQLMLGVETAVSLLAVREIIVKGLLALVLAIPVYPLVRFALRPALVDYESSKRRRWLPRRTKSKRSERRPRVTEPVELAGDRP